MKLKLLIIFPLLTLSLFLSTARGQTNGDDPKLVAELVALTSKIYEAGLKGDEAFLAKHIAADFSERDDFGDFRNTYRSVLYDVGSGENFSHHITEAHVRERGDVAVLSYRWVFKYQTVGRQVVRILGVTDVFHRRNGVWQMLSTHRDFSGDDFPAVHGQAQKPLGDRLEKIKKFWAQHPKVRFNGEFVPLPPLLVKKLELQFFRHRFYIVRIRESLDISWRDANVIVVLDSGSNEVVSTLRAHGQMPESFRNILTSEVMLRDRMESNIMKVKILADLILSLKPDNDRSLGNRVGSIYSNDKMISAELIYDTAPRLLLQVELQKDKFGSLSLVQPPIK